MNTILKFLSILLLSIIIGCTTAPHQVFNGNMDDCPIIGSYVKVGENKVLSCNQKLLKDTVRLPLSYLTEEMEIIKLDNRDEALIPPTAIQVSDNYLLSHCQEQIPFRLFDRKGKFLTNIGSIGQGPGEYTLIYDAQLDEKNNRIYLLPWQSNKILVYDLQGNILDPIPLCINTPKGKFHVNLQDSTVAVVLLPFPDKPAFAWTQDLHGNRKDFIEPGSLVAPYDYSNEVYSSHNIKDVFDVRILCIIPTREDSLYHYDYKNNYLYPQYTMKYELDPIPWHDHAELPHHFLGYFSAPPVKEEFPCGFGLTNGETFHYIVEKETCKGAYVELFNDFLGNIKINFPTACFSNGYYVRCKEPVSILEDIEKALKENTLSKEMEKKLEALQRSINENDNSYVFLAPLKK